MDGLCKEDESDDKGKTLIIFLLIMDYYPGVADF